MTSKAFARAIRPTLVRAKEKKEKESSDGSGCSCMIAPKSPWAIELLMYARNCRLMKQFHAWVHAVLGLQ